MKTNKIIPATFFMMALLAAVAPAQAQPAAECVSRIGFVQADLDNIYGANGIGGGNSLQTYDSLTSKLQNAITKINKHKYPDSVQKLQDFKTAVTAMRDGSKPKLTLTDADLLLDGNADSDIDEGVNGAIACVALLP